MNGYARLSHVKSDVAGLSAGVLGMDATLLRLIDEVSREFDRETGRHFYANVATKYFDGVNGTTLWLDDDLLSITSLKVDANQDQTYSTTYASATDYWLWPDNATPYRRVDINSQQITANAAVWPVGRRRVQIAGTWGYSNETEDTGITVVDAAGMTAVQTTIVVANAIDAIDPGETIIIGTEQMYVSSLTATQLTVQRGINGTTAAVHALGAAISRRRYPRDVENAIKERVVGLRWDTQSGYQAQAMLTGEGGGSRAAYARWRMAVMRYATPASVVV